MLSFHLPLLTVALTLPVLAQGGTFLAISEIRIDQPSTDNDEYVELIGSGGATIGNMTYLVIGDGASSAGSGVIECVVDLNGVVMPPSGYLVIAENTFTLGTADLVLTPNGLNFENGDNVTHMIVSGFTGALDDDLDTDDDGVLDITPWFAIEDCIALIAVVGGGDQVYCAETIGPDGPFVPGHVFNGCLDGWQIGSFTLGAQDTPGQPNLSSCLYGVNGCDPNPNSTGSAGFMNRVTNPCAGDPIEFSVGDCPPGEMGYFFAARNTGSIANPGGSAGVLCAVSDTARFVTSFGTIDPNGNYSAVLNTAAMPNNPTVSALAGEVWHFQFWHRDGLTNNFTDSLELEFFGCF